MSRLVAIVLAAGGSSRMGAPKQLLLVDGETLVRRAARTALASGCDEVIVVLGADREDVAGALEGLAVRTAENSRWREGLASSIRCGLDAAAEGASPLAAVLLLPADQPGVTPAVLQRLVSAFREQDRALVACEYCGALGAPALFAGGHLEALRSLRGDRGAKALLAERAAAVHRIPFPEGALDLDTPADYEKLVGPVEKRPA